MLLRSFCCCATRHVHNIEYQQRDSTQLTYKYGISGCILSLCTRVALLLLLLDISHRAACTVSLSLCAPFFTRSAIDLIVGPRSKANQSDYFILCINVYIFNEIKGKARIEERTETNSTTTIFIIIISIRLLARFDDNDAIPSSRVFASIIRANHSSWEPFFNGKRGAAQAIFVCF